MSKPGSTSIQSPEVALAGTKTSSNPDAASSATFNGDSLAQLLIARRLNRSKHHRTATASSAKSVKSTSSTHLLVPGAPAVTPSDVPPLSLPSNSHPTTLSIDLTNTNTPDSERNATNATALNPAPVSQTRGRQLSFRSHRRGNSSRGSFSRRAWSAREQKDIVQKPRSNSLPTPNNVNHLQTSVDITDNSVRMRATSIDEFKYHKEKIKKGEVQKGSVFVSPAGSAMPTTRSNFNPLASLPTSARVNSGSHHQKNYSISLLGLKNLGATTPRVFTARENKQETASSASSASAAQTATHPIPKPYTARKLFNNIANSLSLSLLFGAPSDEDEDQDQFDLDLPDPVTYGVFDERDLTFLCEIAAVFCEIFKDKGEMIIRGQAGLDLDVVKSFPFHDADSCSLFIQYCIKFVDGLHDHYVQGDAGLFEILAVLSQKIQQPKEVKTENKTTANQDQVTLHLEPLHSSPLGNTQQTLAAASSTVNNRPVTLHLDPSTQKQTESKDKYLSSDPTAHSSSNAAAPTTSNAAPTGMPKINLDNTSPKPNNNADDDGELDTARAKALVGKGKELGQNALTSAMLAEIAAQNENEQNDSSYPGATPPKPQPTKKPGHTTFHLPDTSTVTNETDAFSDLRSRSKPTTQSTSTADNNKPKKNGGCSSCNCFSAPKNTR